MHGELPVLVRSRNDDIAHPVQNWGNFLDASWGLGVDAYPNTANILKTRRLPVAGLGSSTTQRLGPPNDLTFSDGAR